MHLRPSSSSRVGHFFKTLLSIIDYYNIPFPHFPPKLPSDDFAAFSPPSILSSFCPASHWLTSSNLPVIFPQNPVSDPISQLILSLILPQWTTLWTPCQHPSTLHPLPLHFYLSNPPPMTVCPINHSPNHFLSDLHTLHWWEVALEKLIPWGRWKVQA